MIGCPRSGSEAPTAITPPVSSRTILRQVGFSPMESAKLLDSERRPRPDVLRV